MRPAFDEWDALTLQRACGGKTLSISAVVPCPLYLDLYLFDALGQRYNHAEATATVCCHQMLHQPKPPLPLGLIFYCVGEGGRKYACLCVSVCVSQIERGAP